MQMNMTSRTFLAAKMSSETVCPEMLSGSWKSGAEVPSSSIVEGVSDMLVSSVRESFIRIAAAGVDTV